MSERVKDPVCGMEIEKDTSEGFVEYMGRIFYFCNVGCKEKFQKEPMEYLVQKEDDAE